MGVLPLLKLDAKIFASRKTMKKQTLCKYARIFFCMFKKVECMPNWEKRFFCFAVCVNDQNRGLWMDFLNPSSVHRRPNQHHTHQIYRYVLCRFLYTDCNPESWDLSFQEPKCGRNAHVIFYPYRNKSHRDWTAHVAMDPGVTLEKHMFSMLLETTKYSSVQTL